MAKTFQVSAIVSRVSSMKDGGLSVGFVTKELSKDDKVTIMEFHNTSGWLLFREDEFKDEEVPSADTPDIFGESPSRRLRNVLFVWWKQLPEPKTDFDIFYKHQMEQRINQIKTKLED